MLRCERIETALRSRVWTLHPKPGPRRWTGLLLISGAATLETPEGQSYLEPSMICLTPTQQTVSLRIAAGSEGMLFGFDAQSTPLVTGRGADAELLLQLLDTLVLARLGHGDISQRQVEFALELVIDTESSLAPGPLTLHDAALKIVLVAISRNLPSSVVLPDRSDRSTALLQRFRHLLERRFRDRWSVARYAHELGIGADRLHDLCTTKLQKPPSLLIAERSVYEAKLLLRNTAASIEDVAGRLGFKDPSHFSRYFSRAEGVSPRDYRRQISPKSEQDHKNSVDFANWP